MVPSDYPDPVAADWPDLLEIVERRVKPERDKQTRDALRDRWWQYGEKRPGLRSATDNLSTKIAWSRVSPQLAIGIVTGGMIEADSTIVAALNSEASFAVLQSRLHEVWARFFSSSMKDDLRYAPSDCFETFPFPPSYEDNAALEDAGRRYLTHRASLMEMTQKGMTKTYNDFHDATTRASNGLTELRKLHADMDRAVLRAYGWNDLAATLAPVFLAKPPGDNGKGTRAGAPEDDHTYQGRLFWPQAARDIVLARLLALNATRAAGHLDPTYGDAADTAEDAAE